MFSSRVPEDLAPNALALAVERRRSRRLPYVDLTLSNPTEAGFAYPPALLDALADPAGLRYRPEPFGLARAREAVACDYRRRGVAVEPSRIVLTASSSESYAWLFKLLCDPGDAVLVPTPSYPLFEHLTRLELVQALPYETEYHGRWILDLDALRRALTPSTRAVLIVSPNNPTGQWLTSDELHGIGELCATNGLALIGDEVFCEYPLDRGDTAAASVLCQPAALSFSLGGFSKSLGLPQLKLGWIGIGGPADQVNAALARLEIIADTYLSVATPVQQAAPDLFEAAAPVRRQISDRVLLNYRVLRESAAAYPACDVLRAEGGWSAVLRVPATRADDAWVITLLADAGVLVHPGFFFDFPRDGHLVLSLLPEPPLFRVALSRLLAVVAGS